MTTTAGAVQTVVSQDPPIGAPGVEYDNSDSDIVSWIATVDMPYGVLCYESVEGKATLPTATGNVTGGRTGITMIDHNNPSQEGYKAGDLVRVMKRGRVWVLTEEQLAFGDTLFARFAAGTGTQKGAFRNDADTATCSTPTNMQLLKAGTAALAAVSVGDVS